MSRLELERLEARAREAKIAFADAALVWAEESDAAYGDIPYQMQVPLERMRHANAAVYALGRRPIALLDRMPAPFWMRHPVAALVEIVRGLKTRRELAIWRREHPRLFYSAPRRTQLQRHTGVTP